MKVTILHEFTDARKELQMDFIPSIGDEIIFEPDDKFITDNELPTQNFIVILRSYWIDYPNEICLTITNNK